MAEWVLKPMKQVTIASRASQARKAHDALMPEVAAAGYSGDSQFAIRLALDEALANAMFHGNGGDPTKNVLVEYEVNNESVYIKIQDEGHGFNPKIIPDPTLEENLCKPNGRGIMLMKAYMSKVSFDDMGRCVTLIKNRNCKRPVTSYPTQQD